MIFARRALQRRLDELRPNLGDAAVDSIVMRLNSPGKDRLAAMWEVVVLHGLANAGSLESEKELPTGRRPDAWFANDDFRFVADVTCVSDDGLDQQNPYAELGELIEKAKTRLKLPMGGVDIRVHSREENSRRGRRTILKLPSRNKLVDFVENVILPTFRDQLSAGAQVLRISINDDEVGIDVVVDPSKSPYSSYSFAAYDVPTIKDRNPLYNALKSKAEQLRAAPGVKGIILGDGDCAALSERDPSSRSFTAEAIAGELLRQYSSIDFVLMLTIREDRQPWFSTTRPKRWVHPILVCQRDSAISEKLEAVFQAMLGAFPRPINMPVNGARRAREAHYEMGYHGAGELNKTRIRISSRELIEVLAGLRTLDDNGARNVEAARRLQSRPNATKAAFFQQLWEGRLPTRIDVEKTDENENDDWVTFEFGDADPSIAPFK